MIMVEKQISGYMSPAATAVEAFVGEVEPAVFEMLGLNYVHTEETPTDNGRKMWIRYDWNQNQIVLIPLVPIDKAALQAAADFIRDYAFNPQPYLEKEQEPKTDPIVELTAMVAASTAKIAELDAKVKELEAKVPKAK